jgi:DNA-binding MarR family transcriptional regulator
MHQSTAVLPYTREPALPATDQAVDELGAAVLGLMHTWRCLGRRGSDPARSGLATLEMAVLIGPGERRLGELAELRNVDQSVISRQIAELEAQRLVCRRPDPSDRRASLVRLTPDGLELLAQARRLRRQWLRDALARTPTTDVRTATELISALTAEFEAHVGDLGPPRP